MKYKILSLILICALLSNIGAATTANKDLPTKYQVITFIETVPIGDNFTKIASEMAVAEHPTWKWDIWQSDDGKAISIYNTDKESKKGYGSTYFNDTGAMINKLCYVNLTFISGYNGTEEVQVVENVTEPVEEVVSDEVIPDEIMPKNNTTPKIIKVVNSTTTRLTSEISIYAKNVTSSDSVKITGRLNEPTETTIGHWTEVFRNAMKAIFG